MRFKLLFVFSFLFVLASYAQSSVNNSTYQIGVRAPSKAGKTVILAQYYQGKTYCMDSAVFSSSGIAVLNPKEKLPDGQYLIYIRPDIQLELLISNEQPNIRIDIDGKDAANSKITGSKDTQLLWEYIREVNSISEQSDALQKQLKAQGLSAEKKKHIETQIAALDKKQSDYVASQIKLHKDEWFATFIKGTVQVELPVKNVKNTLDAEKNREYAKSHYFDNVSFTDPRLWRTNYFPELIDNYITNIIEQIPDTVANHASLLVGKSVGNDFCFIQMLSRLMNYSMQSKLMGMENVWAKLAEDYVFDKKNPLITMMQEVQMKDKYEPLKLNRIGMTGQNIRIADINGDTINTNDIKAEYTILYFYNPTCEHCKKITPLLRDNIYAKYKDKGLHVIAIDIDSDIDAWQNYVTTNKITDWTNCADPNYKSDFWKYYDTGSIPAIYVLDRNKKIVARKIDEQNLEKFFDFYIGK